MRRILLPAGHFTQINKHMVKVGIMLKNSRGAMLESLPASITMATGQREIIMSALTGEDRAELARLVVNLLDDWGVKAADQVNILALPEGTPTRMLRRYRDNTPLPDDPDVLKRVEHLMGIADALRTTFPRNASIGLLWIKQPCRRLRRRPIELIVEEGLSGLIKVRTHLDCSFAWRETERTD